MPAQALTNRLFPMDEETEEAEVEEEPEQLDLKHTTGTHGRVLVHPILQV